jgi:hypothetical protein
MAAGWHADAPSIDRLNAETLKALQIPAVKARLEEMGGEARGSTPAGNESPGDQ